MKRTSTVLAACVAMALTLPGCIGAGEEPETKTPANPTPGGPLNLHVATPVTGAFHGGPWTYAVGAAWYINAKGEKLRSRFVIDNTRDKRLRVKLWETAYADPCTDSYGSLAKNRWLTFTVPGTPGITRDPDEGFRYPGGLIRVAYANGRLEETQVADSVAIDVDEIEPVVRGSLAAETLTTPNAIALAGDFAVELCVDKPVVLTP